MSEPDEHEVVIIGGAFEMIERALLVTEACVDECEPVRRHVTPPGHRLYFGEHSLGLCAATRQRVSVPERTDRERVAAEHSDPLLVGRDGLFGSPLQIEGAPKRV